MRRALPLCLLFGLSVAGGACGKPTEIVVRLTVDTAPPSLMIVKLQRSTPFPASMPTTPGFVVPVLNGAALDLYVTPQGSETSFSLIPAKTGPKDLRISLLVPGGGFVVTPAAPQDVTFADGESQTVSFSVASPQPDLGGPPDGGRDAAPTDARAGG